MNIKKLKWEDKYAVGVAEIDHQHKFMFAAINQLLDILSSQTKTENLKAVVKSIIEYKTAHFATEEKYFKKFNYSGAKEHIAKHREFNEKLTELQKKHPEYSIEFAFDLVDFLEDWLIDHLMIMDQKYRECFSSNGLK